MSAATSRRSLKNKAIVEPVDGGPRESRVASFFFATKQWKLDGNDRRELDKLAASCATRVHYTGELVGRVVGHADVRRSANPANQQLSANRAKEVRSHFVQAIEKGTEGKPTTAGFVAKGVGHAESSRDPKCTRKNDEKALAHYRRADLYLTLPTRKQVDDSIRLFQQLDQRLRRLEDHVLPRLRDEEHDAQQRAAAMGSRKYRLDEKSTSQKVAEGVEKATEILDAATGGTHPGEWSQNKARQLYQIREFEKAAEKAEAAVRLAEKERDQLAKKVRQHPLSRRKTRPELPARREASPR